MSHLQYFAYEGFGERVKKEIHYSPAVRVNNMIEISGQGGWDRITEVIPEDTAGQIAQAFDNVQHAMEKAGGKGWEQVYKVRVYVARTTWAETVGPLVENLRKYCPNHQPLLTVLGVETLALETMKIEIEAVAHLG